MLKRSVGTRKSRNSRKNCQAENIPTLVTYLPIFTDHAITIWNMYDITETKQRKKTTRTHDEQKNLRKKLKKNVVSLPNDLLHV